MSTVTAKEAFNTLKSKFNMQELKMLAFSVGIPFEDLEGNGRSGKALAMVQYSQRHGKFDQLVEEMNAPRDEDVALTQPAAVPTSNVINNYYHGDVVQGDKVGGDNIEIGSISDSEGIAVGKESSANVTNQTTTPADPPPTVNQYTFNGPVVGSSIGEGSSVHAQNIAGGNITIGSKEDFKSQLATLEALIQKAIANNEIPADEVDGVQDDLNDTVKEIAKKTPKVKRLKPRLQYLQEVLEKSAGIAQSTGKAGTAVLQALPIATSLLNAASTLF
jgi:hypothetical protein